MTSRRATLVDAISIDILGLTSRVATQMWSSLSDVRAPQLEV
jgi:hypothetical protein